VLLLDEDDGALELPEEAPEAGWSLEDEDALELGELGALLLGVEELPAEELELGLDGAALLGELEDDEDELGELGRLVMSLDVELELEPELAPRFASPGRSQP
jgi:hypothetical protein